MDTLTIHALDIPTIIGVYPEERTQAQILQFNLELGIDNSKAAAEDNISDALDYATVTEKLIHYVQQTDYQLVETLVEQTANYLITTYQLPWLRLSITKQPFDLPNIQGITISIERPR